MIYIAVLIQESKGCDHTIECGTKVLELEASSLQEAEYDLKEIIEEEFSGDKKLKAAYIYECPKIKGLDLRSIYDKQAYELELQSSRQILMQEWDEYQRLKLKFNNR